MTIARKPRAVALSANDEDLNDAGNADLLARHFWGQLAWVPEIGVWRHWNGRRWIDDNDEAMRDAVTVARSWFDDLAQEPDTGRQKRILAHAQRSSSARSLSAMLEIARTRGLTVPLREWDANAMLLGTPTGVVDLRTGKLLAPDPRLRIAKSVACDFDGGAEAPTWCSFLDRIMAGDVAMIAFLQRAVGYSLSGSTREQVLFIPHGTGSNGKSVFLRAVRDLSDGYGRDCAAETLLARRDNGIPNDIARLAGARFVGAVETEDGRRLAEAMVKAVTGGDRITARFLHREFFEFVPEFKLWLATNHKPVIRGDDHAIWRRIRLIPFNVTIPDAEQDRDLQEKLAAERPGILRWAVDGCVAWQRDGLQTPEAVATATAAYRADSDRIGQWIDERCIAGSNVKVQAGLAYGDYRGWAEARGEHAMTLTNFGNRLTERGIYKTKAKTVTYNGIGLCDTSPTLATNSSFFSSRECVYGKNGGNVSQVSQGVAVDPEAEAERAAIEGEPPLQDDVEYRPVSRGE